MDDSNEYQASADTKFIENIVHVSQKLLDAMEILENANDATLSKVAIYCNVMKAMREDDKMIKKEKHTLATLKHLNTVELRIICMRYKVKYYYRLNKREMIEELLNLE